MTNYLIKLKDNEIIPYFIEEILPYLDCPLNVKTLKEKRFNFLFKKMLLVVKSMHYCFSLLYKGSITDLGTTIDKSNLVSFLRYQLYNHEISFAKIRLYYFLLFVQERTIIYC